MKDQHSTVRLKIGSPALLLTILFLLLKVTGFIDWSWWLVFLPMWIAPAIVLGVVAFVAVVTLICAAVAAIGWFVYWLFTRSHAN